MDLEQIGYFLYMEEQDRQQEQLKVNAEIEIDFIKEKARLEENNDSEKYFS